MIDLTRTIVATVFTLLASAFLHAQLPPPPMNFDFPIYLTDTMGNRDTLILGIYDGAPDGYNPNLGEEDLRNVPWDTVFESRLMTFNSPYCRSCGIEYTGKKLVMSRVRDENRPARACGEFTFPRQVNIAVASKHPPVTISWDTTAFDPDGPLRCFADSYILNSSFWVSFDNWYLALPDDRSIDVFSCLASSNQGRFANWGSSFRVEQVLDGTVNPVSIPYFPIEFYATGDSPEPCRSRSVSSTDQSFAPFLTLAPNPTNDLLNISVAEGQDLRFRDYHVFSLTGRRLLSGAVREGASLDVSTLPPGIYLLRLRESNSGALVTKKFVKR